ncbi:hypothetical protein FRB96_005000 [Tulasnella sp. 330]|nr:hypothetical protein FRB96_005000 [Tulasnella sp. 330]
MRIVRRALVIKLELFNLAMLHSYPQLDNDPVYLPSSIPRSRSAMDTFRLEDYIILDEAAPGEAPTVSSSDVSGLQVSSPYSPHATNPGNRSHPEQHNNDIDEEHSNSQAPGQSTTAQPGTGGATSGTKKVLKFIQHLFDFISDRETDHLARWTDDGKHFQVLNEEEFMKAFMIFANIRTSQFSSFHRQLTSHDIHKINKRATPRQQGTEEPVYGVYYHKRGKLMRGGEDLLHEIYRKQRSATEDTTLPAPPRDVTAPGPSTSSFRTEVSTPLQDALDEIKVQRALIRELVGRVQVLECTMKTVMEGMDKKTGPNTPNRRYNACIALTFRETNYLPRFNRV